MSFFLVFLAVLLIGAVIWTSVGGRAGKQGGHQLPSVLVGGLEEPPANLPPVLLPANAAPQDVDSARMTLHVLGRWKKATLRVPGGTHKTLEMYAVGDATAVEIPALPVMGAVFLE